MSGPLVRSLDALELSLANSYYFQQWQGNAWDATEAATHIWQHGLPDADPPMQCADLQKYRPFVELYHAEEGGITYELDGASNSYIDSGVLIARFEQDVLPADQADKRQAEKVFDTFIDNLVRTNDGDKPGLVELAAMPGFFFWERLMVEPTVRTSPAEAATLGDAQARFLIFEYGAV